MRWLKRVCEKSDEIAAILEAKFRVLEKILKWHSGSYSGGLRIELAFITLSKLGFGCQSPASNPIQPALYCLNFNFI